jgi:hypothetical protein
MTGPFRTHSGPAAADPLRIGLSLSLTGPTAPAGKQVLTGLEIWRDDVNAKGGLLGRPVDCRSSRDRPTQEPFPPFDVAPMLMSNDYPIVVRPLPPAIARRIAILHLTPARIIEVPS